ncbi:hypothetical protein KC717_01195 [Candidatus Dojkabacteria bacterium]|uniref:Uncharacterized protein n=1 Tax=Candidatus Dojkabacteria bacterium TaxID=2099670 RepID=A0A955RKA5_9BACT|nr:hypothetical protein [Candidatus Dojkabacteria bacterium]
MADTILTNNITVRDDNSALINGQTFVPENLFVQDPILFLNAFLLYEKLQELSLTNARVEEYKKEIDNKITIAGTSIPSLREKAATLAKELDDDLLTDEEIESVPTYERTQEQIDLEKGYRKIRKLVDQNEQEKQSLFSKLREKLFKPEEAQTVKERAEKLTETIQNRQEEQKQKLRDLNFADQIYGRKAPDDQTATETSPLDESVLLRLYDNNALDSTIVSRYLTDEQKAILKKLPKRESALKSLVKDRAKQVAVSAFGAVEEHTTKVASYGVDKFLDRLKTSRHQRVRIAAKRINRKRKFRGKNIIKLIGEYGVYQLSRPLRKVKDIATTIYNSKRILSARNAVSAIKTGIGTKWNNVVTSTPVQYAVKTKNALGSGIRGAGHVLKGARTGLLIAAPLIFINPALAPVAFAVGTGAGTVRSFMDAAYALDLKKYNPNNFKLFNRLDDLRLRIALSNPNNAGIKLVDISSDLTKSQIRNLGITERVAISDTIDGRLTAKFASTRGTHVFLKSLDWFGAGMLAASAFGLSGGAAVATAMATGTAGILFHRALDALSHSIKMASPKLLHLLKFPGGGVLNMATGAFSVADQYETLKEGGLDAWWKDQQSALVFGVGYTKGISNLLGTFSYISGTGAITSWLSQTAVKAGTVVSAGFTAAAFIPVAVYTVGGLLGFWQVTVGGIIATTVAGTIAAAVGAFVGAGTFGLGSVAAGVGTYTALEVSGLRKRLADLIDSAVARTSAALDLFGGIMSLMGVYNLFKAFNDLINGAINQLSDYSIALTIAITFASSLVLLQDLANTPAASETTVSSEEASSNTTGLIVESDSSYSYTIPPIEFDCSEDITIPSSLQNSKISIYDEIVTKERNLEIQHIKGRVGTQEVILRNIASSSNPCAQLYQ